jgi:hypothetical protein
LPNDSFFSNWHHYQIFLWSKLSMKFLFVSQVSAPYSEANVLGSSPVVAEASTGLWKHFFIYVYSIFFSQWQWQCILSYDNNTTIYIHINS